jgi:hypothetical protein
MDDMDRALESLVVQEVGVLARSACQETVWAKALYKVLLRTESTPVFDRLEWEFDIHLENAALCTALGIDLDRDALQAGLSCPDPRRLLEQAGFLKEPASK